MALLGGFVLNKILDFMNVNLNLMLMEHHTGHIATWKIVLTVLFSITLLFSLYRRLAGVFLRKSRAHEHNSSNETDHHHHETEESSSTTITVEGMTCSHCVKHVKESIEEVRGVENATVSLAEKSAVVTGSFNLEEVINAVNSAGYKAK
jgi:copper chaperone CopZ